MGPSDSGLGPPSSFGDPVSGLATLSGLATRSVLPVALSSVSRPTPTGSPHPLKYIAVLDRATIYIRVQVFVGLYVLNPRPQTVG